MRWPWRRHIGVSLKRDETLRRTREAEAAVRQSRASRRAVEAAWPEVRQVAGQLRRARETNHFAEGFRQLIEGHGQ